MALMMDNKPTEYKGEALVWEKLSSLLPNDVVVYNHRETICTLLWLMIVNLILHCL